MKNYYLIYCTLDLALEGIAISNYPDSYLLPSVIPVTKMLKYREIEDKSILNKKQLLKLIVNYI